MGLFDCFDPGSCGTGMFTPCCSPSGISCCTVLSRVCYSVRTVPLNSDESWLRPDRTPVVSEMFSCAG